MTYPTRKPVLEFTRITSSPLTTLWVRNYPHSAGRKPRTRKVKLSIKRRTANTVAGVEAVKICLLPTKHRFCIHLYSLLSVLLLGVIFKQPVHPVWGLNSTPRSGVAPSTDRGSWAARLFLTFNFASMKDMLFSDAQMPQVCTDSDRRGYEVRSTSRSGELPREI